MDNLVKEYIKTVCILFIYVLWMEFIFFININIISNIFVIEIFIM